MPSPSMGDPQVGVGVAGNTNVSLSFEGRTAGGLAASRRASFLAAPGKAPRQFQVYPVVQSVRPATGSAAGGTLVTIAGRGFPSSSMPGNNAITQLLVGGVPCQVVASNFSSITCRTQPQPSAPQPAVMACSANGTVAAASNDTSNSTAASNTTSSNGGQSCSSGSFGGLFPGMRGVMYEQFNRTVGYSQLGEVLQNWTLNFTAGDASAVLGAAWESPTIEAVSFCTRSRAFFTAVNPGNHSFWVVADDFARLRATFADGSSAWLVNITGYTGGMNEWAASPSQRSRPVLLAAGEALLLEAVHCQSPSGPSRLQVGVTVPNTQPEWSSTPEVQRVTVRHSLFGQQRLLTLLAPAGNDSVINITLAATDPAVLRHPNLGLNVTVNGSSLPALVAVADGQQGADAMARLLRQVLKLSSSLALGVEWSAAADGRSVTYQVAAAGSTNIGLLSSVGVSATVAAIAPAPAVPGTCPNATCAFSTPVWVLSNLSSPDNNTSGSVYYATYPQVPIFSSVCSQPLPAAAADASAPTLDGITVAVVPVTVPGVDLRAVQLSIWGSDPFNVIQLPWNASAAAVAAAVDLATGFRPTVTQRRVLDYSWRLSNNTLPFNTALQPADTTAGAPQLPDGASLTLQLFRNASQPFGGSFTLSLGSFCDAVTVQVGESEDSFRAKINSLPGVGGAHAADGVEVQRAVDENARLIYTVTFSSLAGDLPELRVVDSSNVTGSQPSVTVTTLQNGSTDAFYGPIPGEMLRVPVTYNNTVQLEVNGVAAACGSTYETTLSLPPGSAADAAVCGFSHSIAATPIVTRVVPTVPINASNLVPVVIDGTLFSTVAKDNTVFLGPSPCSNVAVRATSGQYATQLGCSITAETTTGVRQVLVTVAGRGLAAGNFTVSLKTLLLVSRSPASSTLSGAGITVFNINGRGFDTARCSRNWVWVGGVQCAVLSCTTKQLTVWYPGGVEDAAAAVRVSVQSDDGSFDPATSTADALWTVPVAAAGSSGWRVAALQSDPVLPVGGAEVVFSVEGFDTSSISRWKVQLLPAADLSSSNMTDPAFSASISSSIASGITCSSLVAQDASTAVCKLRVVPPGTYWLAVSYMGATLILQPNMSAPDSSKERGLLKSRFGVRSVTPQIGSIGGGSLLSIAGQGFDALDLSTAVVVILVPVSTTFLNGVILCDVANISSSGDVLTCRTRAHLATAASSDDAMGFKLEARDTEPGSVQLLLCSDMPSNDALKLYCWDDPTPRTTCYGTQPGACSFSYSWAVTPLVTSTSPVAGVAGDTLLVTGRALEDVTAVWLQASWGRLACSAVQVTGSNVTCTIPEAPAGSYQVVLQKANGELGVDAVPSQPARFVYSPVITAVRSGGGAVAAGSMQGGALLQLASSAAAFNTTAIDQNRVLVGGLPCEVDAGSVTATQLACRAPSLAGQLLAEFWQMPAGTRVIPQDFGSYSRPDTRMFMPQLDVSWGASAPAGISSDSFAGRFRFVLRVPVGGNHSFTLNVDDQARLIIDDEVLLDSVVGYTGTASMLLQQGWHDVEVHFMEFGGGASIRLAVSVDGGPSTTIPQSQSYLARPGNMVPVQAWINGAAARSNCSSSSSAVPSTATPPSPAPDTSEATSLAAAGPACGCFSSSYLTPSVTSFAVSAAPDSGAPSVLTLTGALLTNQAGDVTVTVGGEQCSITEAAANGSSISCTLPALPAGDADVMLAVAGAGYAAMPGGSNTVRITTPLVTRSLTPARGSYHGGVVLSVAGSGFAKLPSNSSVQMEVTIFGSAPGPIAPALASATNVLAAIRLPYYKALVSAATRQLTLQLRVFDRASNATVATATLPYILDTAYTPSVTRVTPATLEPFTAANLTLSWSVGAAAAGAVGVNDRLPAGTASVARVFLQGGATGRAYECGLVAGEGATPQVVITTSNLNSTGGSYQEAIACQLPATLPAAAYDVWVCLEGVGCGFAAAAVRVPVNVSSISRSAGSIAGGTELDIAGTGFSPEVGAVAVSFGNSSCAVTAVNATAITCVTGALAANMTAGRAYAAVITPSQGATAQAFNSTTFTYDAALTPILASVTPARGSTEGGTAITITGSFPDSFAGNMSVTLGSTTCSSALLVNISTITCTSGNPTAGNATAPRPRGPQAVRVLFEGLGYAATLQQLQSANTSATAGNVTAASSSAAGAVTYEYVDLWSRRTTWGGGDPPVEGDMVLVPAGTTVLLDVSPPLLSALVLEGDLLFDDNAGEEIHLQAGYILVKGGSLQVGSEERPFPGAACITLHGGPDSPEIPLYGGKVLAVRDGSVRLHGLPKQPTWTVLNATANVGDTSITVNGPINWQVGDRIVIASSSFYATDVDEATITNITALGASSEGSAAVQLELDVPLVYTHLGEVVTVPGDSHVLDMRAEVAVLNRNVRLMGDPSSPETLYGAQVMVSTPARRPRAILRFTHVEVQWGGQAFRLGRYPIHWHMHGDAAMQSWVKGCSIHHSFQRAVTIHGTHRVLLENNVAYDIMGHTYFFEDALEWGSVLRGNLGILTRVSNAMLNTDTTPATYWITNPNNTIENNVAAGSAGYGFWYRLLDFPEGPSFTTSYCPKFVALRRFANNAAHSNMFYGLRIHPEYYPKTNPCDNTFQQLPAVFDGFISYKNGVKGAMCTQVGLVQLRNFAVADNGAGPRVHVINGKEHGGGIEIAWVVDDRSQANVVLENMAGVQDSLIISRTEAGRQGTAGAWPSNRGVRGLITQSPPHAHPRHSALMSVINVTFVNFTTSNSQFRALEACGKCKNFQGGATTFTRNLTFIQQGKPALADWSWGHQGIYLDTDGSLINQNTLDSGDLPTGWNLGPGVTYHSAVESQLFNQPECVYIGNGNAAYCKPDLAFRRVMLNGHGPIALKFRDLLVTSDATNRTSRVHHTNYNEDGYQFTCATRRSYWLHWDTPYQLSPETFSLHKPDLMNATHGWLYLTAKWPQVYDRVTVNGKSASPPAAALPATPFNASHGSLFYNKTLSPVGWWWGNETFNMTTAAVLLAGRSDSALRVTPVECPVQGCNVLGKPAADFRNGTLLWSDNATWANTTPGKPRAGSNVTIPFGWNLVIDESPPPLYMLVIEGNVWFSNTTNITLAASFIIVQRTGVLLAGSPDAPHPTPATILLAGTRQTPQLAISNDLVLGSKVLAVVAGGRLSLHGSSIPTRITRLAAPAAAGSSSITVDGSSSSLAGWSVGKQILVTSTTFNPDQVEFRRIAAVQPAADSSQLVLVLDSLLAWSHGGGVYSYANSAYALDTRAEVALLDSNVVIAPADGSLQYDAGGNKFGPRVLAAGNSSCQLANIQMSLCGQAGLTRACVQFQGLTGQAHDNSYLRSSVILRAHDAALRTLPGTTSVEAASGVLVRGNVFFESYDTSTVVVGGHHALLEANLALGTTKDMSGER
uniref:Fibrocystin-L n=1 Tax=Tetradesmus obliquus TaxID=3088 RepID=A0A383WCP6_TETOB